MQRSINHHRRRWMRRAMLAAVAVTAVLALPVSGAFASGLSVKLHAPGHTMSIAKGKTWKYTVETTHNGKKIGGKVRYQFIFASIAEHTQAWQKFKDGKYSGTLKPWTNSETKLAVGLTLTFRVEVDTKYGDKTINYPVTITK